MDHTNLFHEALLKVRDIARNGSRDFVAWEEVLAVIDAVLEEAVRLDGPGPKPNPSPYALLLSAIEEGNDKCD